MGSRSYGTALSEMGTLTPRNPPRDLGSQPREPTPDSGFPGTGTRSGFRVPRYGNPQWVPGSHVREPAVGSGFPGTGTRTGFRVPGTGTRN